MRRQIISLGVLALAVTLLATTGFAANRGATFTPIGTYPTCDEVPEGEWCENFPFTFPLDISGDGTVVVGQSAIGNSVMRWTEAGGLEPLGIMSGGVNISRDGSTIVANTASEETWPTPNGPMTDIFAMAGYWLGGVWPSESWFVLPQATVGMIGNWAPCGGSAQSQFGVSPDGQVITGLTWDDEDGNGNACEGAKAFMWRSDTGVTSVLDNGLSGSGSNRSNAVSQDGAIVTGWSAPGRTASYWDNNVETYICTGAQSDWFCNEGWDVSPDGRWILFSGASPSDFNTRAAIYDTTTGAVEQLPFPDAPFDPFWDSFQGWAISDDGNTVVGEFGGGGFFGSPPYPVVWNRDLGMTLDLHVFLLGQGLDDLFFWFLSGANAVNSDGTVIAGDGNNPDGWIEGWVVDLSKVKVCHKPDGQGQGNERTIGVSWGSAADHLAHGDLLSTCEFALADGHSRAMEGRRSLVGTDEDPTRDRRIPTMEEINRTRERIGTSTVFSTGAAIANPYPVNDDSTEAPEGGQTEEQRDALRNRVQHARTRR